MASIKINKALATFTTELAIETVDKLFAFLGEKVELDADWTGYFDEFKAQLKKDLVAPLKAPKETKESKAAAKAAAKEAKDAKPKRAPTAYNTFIGQQMALLKESQPTMNAKDRMKEASAIWKTTNAKAVTEQQAAQAQQQWAQAQQMSNAKVASPVVAEAEAADAEMTEAPVAPAAPAVAKKEKKTAAKK